MPIDKESDMPVYQQLATLLRTQIAAGEVRRIPSIRTLAQEHEISHGSVEKALQILRDEGLIHSVIGKGMYVTR